MGERYKSYVDIHIILRDRDGRVLLGLRQNTGFADGSWHLPSGHLEQGESALQAAVREAGEETGAIFDPADAQFVHLLHQFTNAGRVALFFEVSKWAGEISNLEMDKCAKWDWFEVANLPEPIIPYAASALLDSDSGVAYGERGWPSRDSFTERHGI